MELELGLKITKTRDDITSISEYRLAKDRTGPVFQSRETNTMFILTSHLKGYKKNNIVINISEDGSKISISGEKPIQEMVMVGYIMLKKEVEIAGFSKVFKIPDGVVLDSIKAKYDEDESILKIVMPKLVKGICGARIEEVKEEEYDRGGSKLEKSEPDQVVKSVGETSQKGTKVSEVQDTVDNESVTGKKDGGLYEKMLDEANRDIVGQTFKRDTEESKLGIKDRNGENVRDKVGEVEYVTMKTTELEKNIGASIPQTIGDSSQDKEFKPQEMEDSDSVAKKKERVGSDQMLDDANGKIIGETFLKEIEESKLEIKDGHGESGSQKAGKEGYEVMKKSELEKNVGASQNKEYEVQKMEDSKSVMENKGGEISGKMPDGAKREIIGEKIQKETEEYKFEFEDGNGERVKEKDGNEGYDEVMRILELEQNVGTHSQKIGDTSQDTEGLEKMEGEISDNGNITGDIIRKTIEESKLGIEDGHGDIVSQKVDKEGYEMMKKSELEQNVGACQNEESEAPEMKDGEGVMEYKEGGASDKLLDGAKREIIRETIQKEEVESRLGIDDVNTDRVKEKVGKAAYEAVKKPEIEQIDGTSIPQNIGDTRQDKESKVQETKDNGSIVEREKMVSDEMLGDANGNIREMIQKDIEESKLGIEDGDGESVREKNRKVGCEVIKTSELNQNVADHIHSNIGGISQEDSKESEIQQMEKTEKVERKMDGGESKRMSVEAIPKNIFDETILKDIEKPKIENEDGDQESVREKAGKEIFEAKITVREEIPKHLPKATVEESEGSNVLNLQETEDDKEAVVKSKGKEIDYIVEKGEGEEPKMLHVEAKRLIEKDITKKTRQEEIEKPNNGTNDSDQQNVQKNTVKEGFEVPNRITEEFPKQVGKKLPVTVAKMKEPKEVMKEALSETECLLTKVEAEKFKERAGEANKSTLTETLQKEIEESNIERKSKDGPKISDSTVKGAFEVLGTAQQKLPMQVVEEMAQDESDKIEYGMVKKNGEGSMKMHVEVNKVSEEDASGDRIKKEIRKPKLKSSDQLSGQQNVENGGFEESKRQKFPEIWGNEDVKEEGAKIEQSVKNVNGENFEKIEEEANSDFRKDIAGETTQKDAEGPKIQTKEKGQQCLKEEMSTGRFEASNAAKDEFPMNMIDSVANRREGLQDSKIEATKEELLKHKSEKRIGESEDVKDEGADIEQLGKKVKGEKFRKVQLEVNGSLMGDIDREQKEKKEPMIQTKEEDEQCLEEEISNGRLEASTTAIEFPWQIEDALPKKREGPKHQEIEEAEEMAKIKTDETEVAESTTKEKILDTGTPAREFQSSKGPTTWEKIASIGFKEAEQGIAKDKTQKTVLLPPKNPSKEVHESKNDHVEQGILKPKKAKEVGKEQCTYYRESTKAVATIEEQVAKSSEPRFPSAQQSEVEQNSKLYEGFRGKDKASLETQKEDPANNGKNSIEMKDIQESNQMETLKPEAPLEEHLKTREQITRRDEDYKRQQVMKTIQEKTEELENKIDDRDQLKVQRDVGKGVGIVDSRGKEMPQEDYDVGPKAGTMETKRDLEATHEREKYITTQNVNDEKPMIKEELRKTTIEKVDKAKCIDVSTEMTQEKVQPAKSEVFGKEVEPLEAISSLPSVTSMEVGPKNEIEELPQKEISPITEEMKSKQNLELEKQMMEWKSPKTKEYGTKDVKAPKIAVYQGAKPSELQSPTLTQQSMDEKNRKIENVVEAHEASNKSLKENIDKEFQESNERMAAIENEELDTLEPHILESQCLEEKQKVDRKEPSGECELQDIYEDETKAPKSLIVEENNDKKGYQTTKGVEDELLKGEHKAKIVLEERKQAKVAKSEEAKESSEQILKRKRGEITQTVEDKKPKMKEITPEFEEVAEKVYETQRESEKVTSKMGIETTPNKGIEESSLLPAEIRRKGPHELSQPRKDHEIPKTEGNTECLVAADKVTKPSKFSSSSSTQAFEDKENDKTEASREQIETPQPESCPTDEQCINKDQGEIYGIHEIEEENANEHDSQVLEKQKEEASGEKKDETKRSKKFLPLVMAGSALLVSSIVIFIRHGRARKRCYRATTMHKKCPHLV